MFILPDICYLSFFLVSFLYRCSQVPTSLITLASCTMSPIIVASLYLYSVHQAQSKNVYSVLSQLLLQYFTFCMSPGILCTLLSSSPGLRSFVQLAQYVQLCMLQGVPWVAFSANKLSYITFQKSNPRIKPWATGALITHLCIPSVLS